MPVEQLDLNRILHKLGAAKLSSLIGEQRLESICSILGDKITEKHLANIIRTRYGSQILTNRDIRKVILRSLPKKSLVFLAHGDSSSELAAKDLKRLERAGWTSSGQFTSRMLELFGLGDEYRPLVKPKRVSQVELETDTFLHPYQKRVKDRLIRSLLSDKKRLLVHMPTGAGKTRTCIEGLVDFWRIQGDRSGFLIWLTDSEELCDQAEETFTQLWKVRGDRPLNLTRLWGSHKVEQLEESGGLIIASLQKLHRMRTSNSNEVFKLVSEINRRSRLIVVDEAHKSIAPTYKSTIEFICDLENTRLVGLTATPGRTNADEVKTLVEFYGNNKITITDELGADVDDPMEYLQENGYLSKITRKMVPTDITIDLTPEERSAVSDFFEIPKSVLLKLSQSEQRNVIIIKEIAKLNQGGHQIIVFGCSVEHAHLLTELLLLRGIEARCVDGGTSSFDRNAYIQEFKSGGIKVIVNYGVLTTGFDAPNTSAVVITRPTGSLVLYSQMIGRGIRGPKMGGTEDCTLVDMKDNLIGYPSEGTAFQYFDEHWGK